MRKLYLELPTIAMLFRSFAPYLAGLGQPTAWTVFWLGLAMVVLGGSRSVRALHARIVGPRTGRTLSSVYYTLGRAKGVENLGRTCAHAILARVLAAVPEDLRCRPARLIVDDTIVAKWGKLFELVKVLFDHSARRGRRHVNAHDFVLLAVSVDVRRLDGTVRRLTVPLWLDLWSPEGPGKLEMVAEMLRELRSDLEGRGVLLLMDSWHMRRPLTELVREWRGLWIIAAARIDTDMTGLAPGPTGRRGRPRKWGTKLDARSPLDFPAGPTVRKDRLAACRQVLTRLFGSDMPVWAVVTEAADGKGGRRLHLSTMSPDDLQAFFGFDIRDPRPRPSTPKGRLRASKDSARTGAANGAKGPKVRAAVGAKGPKVRAAVGARLRGIREAAGARIRGNAGGRPPKLGAAEKMAAGRAMAERKAAKVRKRAEGRKNAPSPADAILHAYGWRWAIEVIFYELKMFWDLSRHMVRGRTAIGTLVAIQVMCYAETRLLPLENPELAHMEDMSAQEVRLEIGERIRSDLFFHDVLNKAENANIPEPVREELAHCVRDLELSA